MHTTVARYLTLLTAFLTLIALVVNAQDLGGVEQGIKPYGSYHGGDIDTVSMVNGCSAPL